MLELQPCADTIAANITQNILCWPDEFTMSRMSISLVIDYCASGPNIMKPIKSSNTDKSTNLVASHHFLLVSPSACHQGSCMQGFTTCEILLLCFVRAST